MRVDNTFTTHLHSVGSVLRFYSLWTCWRIE